MCFFITVKFEERTTLYELKNQYEDPSSWFIGNTLVKSDGSLNIVTRYSEEKTMEWLKAKALNIANSLSDNNFLVLKLNGPINDETDSKSQVRCAWGMLSDYISVDLSEKLRSKLEIPKKCKIIFGSKNACKEVTATEDYSNTIETKKFIVKEGSLK